MTTKLTIPDDVKSFIEGVISENGYRKELQEAKMAEFISLLEELCLRGASSIEFEMEGYGDSGDAVDIAAYSDKDNAPIKVSKDERSTLKDFGWDAASYIFPGYEINEGGGVNLKFSLDSTEEETILRASHNHWWRVVETDESGDTLLGV